jgi:hypothetical protein
MHAASTPCARAPRDFVRAADFAASAAARLRMPPGYARLIRCVSVRATQRAVQSAERGRVRRALPPGPPAREVSYARKQAERESTTPEGERPVIWEEPHAPAARCLLRARQHPQIAI